MSANECEDELFPMPLHSIVWYCQQHPRSLEQIATRRRLNLLRIRGKHVYRNTNRHACELDLQVRELPNAFWIKHLEFDTLARPSSLREGVPY